MIYTVLWLVMGAYFAVVEYRAIADRRRGDTLSEHVWDWFSLRPGAANTPWEWTRRIGFYVFWLWLTIHFISGGTIA